MEQVKEIRDIRELIQMMHQLRANERISVDFEFVPKKKETQNDDK